MAGPCDLEYLVFDKLNEKEPVRCNFTSPFTRQKIDGVIYLSDDLRFVHILPPFTIKDRFNSENMETRKFKGLSEWYGDFSNLHKITLGTSTVMGCTLCLVYAVNPNKRPYYAKVHKAIRKALIDSVSECSNSTTFSAYKDSVSETVVFQSQEDWQEIVPKWKDKLSGELRFALDLNRESFKFAFILYHFGDNLEVQSFLQQQTLVNASLVNCVIIHVAEDIYKDQNAILFIPERIQSTLRLKVPAYQSDKCVFRAGLQQGFGNYRINFKKGVVMAGLNHEVQLACLTYYTRLWNTIHRDSNGFFNNKKLVNELAEIFRECFFRKTRQSDDDKRRRQLLQAGQISRAVLNSCKLTPETTLSSRTNTIFYPGRVEAVTVRKLSKSDCGTSMLNIVSSTIATTKEYLQTHKLLENSLMFARPIREIEVEAKAYFPYFSGTIKLLSRKIERLINVKEKFYHGTIDPSELPTYEDFIAVEAVGYLLDGYYTGRIFCNQIWRTYLNLSEEELMRVKCDDPHYDPTKRFQSIDLKIVKYQDEDFKIIRIKDPSELLNLCKESRPDLFKVALPEVYRAVIEDFLKFKESRSQIRNAQGRTDNFFFSMDLAASFARFLISSISLCKGAQPSPDPTVASLYESQSNVPLSASTVITTQDIAEVLLNIKDDPEIFKDDSYFLITKLLQNIKSQLHPNFSQHLAAALNAFILTDGYPLVLPAETFVDGRASLPTARFIVPQLLEEKLLEKLGREWTIKTIKNFNSSWERAACISRTSGRSWNLSTRLGCFGTFEALQKLRSSKSKISLNSILLFLYNSHKFKEFRGKGIPAEDTYFENLKAEKRIPTQVKLDLLLGVYNSAGQFKRDNSILTSEQYRQLTEETSPLNVITDNSSNVLSSLLEKEPDHAVNLNILNTEPTYKVSSTKPSRSRNVYNQKFSHQRTTVRTPFNLPPAQSTGGTQGTSLDTETNMKDLIDVAASDLANTFNEPATAIATVEQRQKESSSKGSTNSTKGRVSKSAPEPDSIQIFLRNKYSEIRKIATIIDSLGNSDNPFTEPVIYTHLKQVKKVVESIARISRKNEDHIWNEIIDCFENVNFSAQELKELCNYKK